MHSTSGPSSSFSGQVLDMSKVLTWLGLALLILASVVSVSESVPGTTDGEGETSHTYSVHLEARWIMREGKLEGKL